MSAVLPLLVPAHAALVRIAAETPAPTPPADDDITPGVVGFFVTVVLMIAVLLLAISLVRRVRRVNYRAQIQERLAEEQREAEAGEPDAQPVDASDDEGPAPDDGPRRAS